MADKTEHPQPAYMSPVDPNRHHRMNNWDYRSRAIYHITLAVANRWHLFGELIGDSTDTARIELNEFGVQVYRKLQSTQQFYAPKGYDLQLLALKVMPDHLHFVVFAKALLPQSIGTVVRGFKSGCSSLFRRTYVGAEGKSLPSIPPVIANFASIFEENGGSIWERIPAGYHERILFGKGQLNNMISYVRDNPRRLWLKTHNPDLFRLHRQTEVRGLVFTSLGNHFLLDWPDRQLVEMSRSASEIQIEERLQLVMTAARNGAVTYTAAISQGEKLIARALREQGFQLVVLLSDGFPAEESPEARYYKPGGLYFEACSQGRLLLLEPSEPTLHSPSVSEATNLTLRAKAEARHSNSYDIPTSSQRYRFVALNEIGRRLVEDK
jgi:hypothetical protein